MSSVASARPAPLHDRADIAVHLHEVDLMTLRMQLDPIGLGIIAQFLQVRMPEERVVIDHDLRIDRDQIAGIGHDQRIDLDQTGIELDKRAMQLLDQFAELGRDVAGKADPPGELRDFARAGARLSMPSGSDSSFSSCAATRRSISAPPCPAVSRIAPEAGSICSATDRVPARRECRLRPERF